MTSGRREMRRDPKKVTQSLYHYTTAHGLIGILAQKKIWATHINYLNDKKEFIDAVDEFRKQIKDLRPNVPTLTDTPTPHRTHMETSSTEKYGPVLEILQILHGAIYVTSFSEERDQLSQWRGYCAIGPGFSIGFNRAKLKKLVKRIPTGLLKKCIYEPRVKEKKIERIIKPAESVNLNGRDFLLGMINKMLRIAPYFKDESFKEEKEWRLALVEGGDALFREGDSLIIPYVEFELKDENGNLPIDNIVIGPTLNMKESHSSLKLLLEKHKISANIEESRIPYRPGL